MNRTLRVALTSALLPLAAAVALQGCAVGLLRGAGSAGSSGSGSSTSAPSPAPNTAAAKVAADNAISNSVRARLAANAALKGLNIYVDTHDGVVTLRGQVAKFEQTSAAEANARSVQGVRSVRNLITVR